MSWSCLSIEQNCCKINNKSTKKFLQTNRKREIKGAHWPRGRERQEAVIFVASLKPLWPSSSLSLSLHCCPHWLHCDPGGAERREINWVVQSFFLYCSFYSWPDNQSAKDTKPELCTSLLSHLTDINGKHTNTVLTHSLYCVFSMCLWASVPLWCW